MFIRGHPKLSFGPLLSFFHATKEVSRYCPTWRGEARGGDGGEERAAAGRRPRGTRGGGDRGRLMSARIHTFSLSPPTHRTRGWFLSTHSRVACSSVGRNNVMLCYVRLQQRCWASAGAPTATLPPCCCIVLACVLSVSLENAGRSARPAAAATATLASCNPVAHLLELSNLQCAFARA